MEGEGAMKHFKSAAAIMIILAPFVLPLAGEATIYEWVDDSGVVHFTDSQGKVPSKFIKRVKKQDSGKDGEVKPPDTPAPESSTPSAPEPVVSDVILYGGYDENYWRSSFVTLRGEIKTLEDGLSEKRENLNQLRRKRVNHSRAMDRVERENQTQEIGREEAKLKELQEKLKALDAEASQADVPSEWRQ
jgi:hypothetical protein